MTDYLSERSSGLQPSLGGHVLFKAQKEREHSFQHLKSISMLILDHLSFLVVTAKKHGRRRWWQQWPSFGSQPCEKTHFYFSSFSLRGTKLHLPFTWALSLPGVSSVLTERRGNQSPQPLSETLIYKRGVPSARPFLSAAHVFMQYMHF